MPKRKVSVRKWGASAAVLATIFAAGVTRIQIDGTVHVSWNWPPGTEVRKFGKATKLADEASTRKQRGIYDGGYDPSGYDPAGYDPTEPDRKSSVTPGYDLGYLATRASDAGTWASDATDRRSSVPSSASPLDYGWGTALARLNQPYRGGPGHDYGGAGYQDLGGGWDYNKAGYDLGGGSDFGPDRRSGREWLGRYG